MRSGSFFLHMISLEARKLMIYRVDFWVTMLVNMVAHLVVLWAIWNAIFAESNQQLIGGWDLQGILAYGVMVFLTGRIVRGGDLQMTIATEIYDGSLSRFLVYPRNYVFTKYAQQLGNVAPDLAQSLLMAMVAIPALGLSTTAFISPASLAMAVPSIMVAHLLFFLMSLPPQFVAFWADNVWSLSVLLRFVSMLLGGALLPLSLFPEPLQQVLSWLPFVYLYQFPTLVLLGKVGVVEWATGIGGCLIWCVVVGWLAVPFWKHGSLRYTGVGI
jgi:ABC-2 type transport system permease protein